MPMLRLASFCATSGEVIAVGAAGPQRISDLNRPNHKSWQSAVGSSSSPGRMSRKVSSDKTTEGSCASVSYKSKFK